MIKKILKFKLVFFLSAIFLIAMFLRFYKLDTYPVGFHIDEASLSYNGYSLLKTGKDENNKPFPLYIDMFGDNRPSGYHYLTIPTITLFDLTVFATRAPGALFGSISIFAFFFLAYSIFRDKRIATMAAILLAASIWHIVLSRASAESIVSLFFILTGFALIINSFRTYNRLHLILGSIFANLSFFFYHTPRVFVPFLFLLLILMTINIWKKYEVKYKFSLVAAFVLTALVAVLLVFAVAGGTGRFSQVNILKSFETTFQLNQEITEDAKANAPRILSRAVHNKATNIAYMFVSNYFDYFSGEFLFTKGGLPNWYKIPRVGMLLVFNLPFILYGIYILIRKKDIYSKIPLVWFLAGPVVASLTLDDIPNINRVSVMFPMLDLIAAVGVVTFITNFSGQKRKIVAIFMGLLLAANVSYFLFQYFYNAKVNRPWYRNNGFSAMMDAVRTNYNSYDVILMSKSQGGIYPLVLFYLKFDPVQYQAAGSPKVADYKGFGKIIFVPQDCPFLQYSESFPKVEKTMYIEDGSCPNDKRLKKVSYKIINREDGTSAFRIVYD